MPHVARVFQERADPLGIVFSLLGEALVEKLDQPRREAWQGLITQRQWAVTVKEQTGQIAKHIRRTHWNCCIICNCASIPVRRTHAQFIRFDKRDLSAFFGKAKGYAHSNDTTADDDNFVVIRFGGKIRHKCSRRES